MKLATIISCLAVSMNAAASTIVMDENFDRPESLSKWRKCPTMQYRHDGGIGNSGCVAFASPQPGSGLAVMKLDTSALAGRSLAIEAMMKGINISHPDKRYLGPKLMIHLKSPYGESWPDQTKKYGTYDWEKFTLFVRVPHDVENLELCIGLQGSTGELLVDNLKVTMLPAISAGNANARQQPPLQTEARLRGVMSGHRMEEQDIRELAEEWKANLIRYQIVNFSKSDTVGRDKYLAWIRQELDKMDKVLESCRKYGVKILIDLHSGPAMSQGELLSNTLNWTHESQDTLCAAWELIAGRYKDNPTVWGYDILNEPREENYVYTPDGPLDWNRLAARVVGVIRRIDPVKPVIVEPAQWGVPAGLQVFEPLDFDNIIYSIHFYDPFLFTHQGIGGRDTGISYPGKVNGVMWDKEQLRKALRPALEFQRKYNVPIYVGEFSAVRWAPGAAQWLDDMISIFEEYGWDWTYHAFREFHGWSVEHSSDPKDSKKTISDRMKVLLKYMSRNKQE